MAVESIDVAKLADFDDLQTALSDNALRLTSIFDSLRDTTGLPYPAQVTQDCDTLPKYAPAIARILYGANPTAETTAAAERSLFFGVVLRQALVEHGPMVLDYTPLRHCQKDESGRGKKVVGAALRYLDNRPRISSFTERYLPDLAPDPYNYDAARAGASILLWHYEDGLYAKYIGAKPT